MTVLAAVAALAVAVTAPGAAQAQTATGNWAEWSDLSGSARDYSGTVTLGTAPNVEAEFTSDSMGGGVGRISGASTWLSEGTPVGAKYGSSEDHPYLNLRPNVNNASSPSTTTYKFGTPTGAGFFAFTLGDIDADKVQIKAKDADGNDLSAAQLGYQGSFNYCSAASPGGPSCSNMDDTLPLWNPATTTLTGRDDATDKDGAAGWFEPTVGLSELTLIFTHRSGFPVYQTWFSSMGCDITGTVSDSESSDPVEGATVNLFDANDKLLDSATTGADGTYTFPNYSMGASYNLEVVAPDGMIVEGEHEKTTDLSTCPGEVDFTVREIVPVEVSGEVKAQCGTPIDDAVVTLTLEDGTVRTTTTNSEGTYWFDGVPVGTHELTVAPPEEAAAEAGSTATITVASADQAPITGEDLELKDTGLCPNPPPVDPPGDDDASGSAAAVAKPKGPVLPITGAGLTAVAAAAAAALAAGGLLLAAANRRKRTDGV